jgi:glycine hydroxymethyltransferase
VANARTLGEAFTHRGYRLVAGGTDTHLLLVDLNATGLTGREAEEALDRAGITVNKNAIPFDQRPPTITSGIRVGTPALTTRGMKEKEMEVVADFMDQALSSPMDTHLLARLADQVQDFCAQFPLFAEEWIGV